MSETTNIVGDANAAASPATLITDAASPEAGQGVVAGADAAKPEAEVAKPEAEVAKPEAVVPEKYEAFKMPEGMELPKDLQERAEPVFKELGLTQDQAQKAAEFLAKERADTLKSNADEYLKYVKELGDLARADKEIGGEKLAENASHANQFIQKFGRGEKGAEVFKVLDETGMGNHPAIISLLAKAHRAMSDDTPSSGAPASTGPESVASKLYPSMASK